MPKGISSYIIALILVVIVLIVIGYLIFTYYGGFNKVGGGINCQAQKLRYCFDWQQNSYVSIPDGGWASYAPGCTAMGVNINFPSDCTGSVSTTTTT